MTSSDLAGGSITYPVVMEVKARRAREYAIQLMALEYTFSQDIQFVEKYFDKENVGKREKCLME